MAISNGLEARSTKHFFCLDISNNYCGTGILPVQEWLVTQCRMPDVQGIMTNLDYISVINLAFRNINVKTVS